MKTILGRRASERVTARKGTTKITVLVAGHRATETVRARPGTTTFTAVMPFTVAGSATVTERVAAR